MSFCSRNAAKELVLSGVVTVNGKKITNLMHPVNVKIDKIEVNGDSVKAKPHKYYAINKPVGYETTKAKPGAAKTKKTVYDLIYNSIENNLNPAGRLDKDSHGLIIMTNDNDFLNAISGSEHGITKCYLVKTNAELTESQLNHFKTGVPVEKDNGDMETTMPCVIKLVEANTYDVHLKQGIKRQIRKMFAYFKIKVIDLFRYRIGKLEIGNLGEGGSEKIEPEAVTGKKTLKL
ncbi:MAG TPA: pseudouridine synthase [Candidatus Wallbacteria bacterium]|nr:pseudouridine synthase [Candidatus Wallbacteria bacterium]